MAKNELSLGKVMISVSLATLWIATSEFVRNQLVFKSFWTDQYDKLGLIFPEKSINGAMWGLWSLLFAVAIYVFAQKFSLWETTLLAWLTGFVMMWVVIGNLGVLPSKLLFFAIPLSFLEAFVASWIVKKLSNN